MEQCYSGDLASASALCASCDRCRSRKTKCDGQRPCGNCTAKYMKKNKLSSLEGVDMTLDIFDCVYSPAKRRGPIPGRAAAGSTKNKHDEQQQQNSTEWLGMQAASNSGMIDPAQLAAFLGAGSTSNPAAVSMQQQQHQNNEATIQQQIFNLQQQIQQQQVQGEPSRQRLRLDESAAPKQKAGGIPRTITSHTHLLDRSDPEGARLRAYFKLSIDEIFRLPPTPSDEEYCASLEVPGLTPNMIPGSHLAALSAVRFAEAALGAIVHNEVSLAMELCNAVVHCLRESVQEPVQIPAMFEVAKAYFLLGVFRACRGDMARYFKYRRVCLTYLSKLEGGDKTHILLAAVSYLDSWAYMVYNANEKDLPNVDATIPPIQQANIHAYVSDDDPIAIKYNIKIDPGSIASDPKNKNWIQGPPPVYLNNEAPIHARVLDALACAVRTCCDQANVRFAAIAEENESSGSDNGGSCGLQLDTPMTPTTTAVLAHENELCSRNMVLSAYTLMQSSESNRGSGKSEGHHLVISAMDAFLENGDENSEGGFTDSQIQSLLSVCNTAIENPFLLHHAGPTYHMVSNAAILLAHILNGMHAMKTSSHFGPMESTIYEEVVDTFISARKLLTIHRRKLPVKLRCHGIPRPSFEAQEGQPFIDLGETLLCPCRGCQGFVLMACSPCVAAERARAAGSRMEVAAAQEAEAVEMGELSKLAGEMDFDMDDDALLSMISTLISS